MMDAPDLAKASGLVRAVGHGQDEVVVDTTDQVGKALAEQMWT